MYEENGRLRIVTYGNIPDLSAAGLIVADLGLDIAGMEPLGQVLVIHSEFYKPVGDQQQNNQEDHQTRCHSEQNPADSNDHTSKIAIITPHNKGSLLASA